MCGKFFYRKLVASSARLCLWGLCGGLLFSVQITSAQQALSLQEASRRTLQNSPELQVFQWQLHAVEGQRQTADLPPGFELAIEAENVFGSGDFSGTESAEITVSLSSIIELGGKRQSRVAVAHSRYALAEIEREAKALDLLGQVTQRFIAVLALQEKLQVSEEATRLAEVSWHTVKQRVERGAAPDAERLRAQATLAQARLTGSAIQAELASRRMALATLWGAETVDFPELEGDLYAFESAPDFEVLYRRVAESPAIVVFATHKRLRNAELELVRSQSSSNVQWSLGIRRFDDTGDSALMAGVAIPLFAGRRNQGELKAARAEREMVDYRRETSLLALRARLYEAWQTHQQAVAATKTLRTSVLPTLENALTQTRAAYERGRYSYNDLVSAQRELLDARRAIIDAASTALFNQALIEQLTAEPLAAVSSTTKTVVAKPLDIQSAAEPQSTSATRGPANLSH